jgi:phage portal protein BeeE
MAKAEILSMAKQLNPDLFSPSVLYALPGISMRINYDAHGNILGYIQRPFGTGYKVVDSNTNVNDDSIIPSTHYGGAYPAVQYSPDEVVHFPHEPVGDSIYGTSPIQTALLDIAALWYAKNYGGTFFQNSAIPAYLYIMENESPESKNYKNFITELKKHKQNPHKNMVITGNVRVERVSPQNKDLEFSTFMDKYLQRIVMAWGATARFSHLFTDKLETPANLESYYKKINETQSEIEEKLNNELFSQFDVEFYFNRIYKRDESREADIVTKLVGLTLTVNEAREYLGYKPLPGEEFNTLSNTPKRSTISEAEAADRRTDQNMENPSAPGRPKDGVKEQTEK